MASQLLQFLISGLSVGCIYAIVALGFFIFFSVTRVLNIAQGEFVMLGGMLTVSFYAMGIPLLLSIFFAVAIAGIVGGGLYRLIIYPVRNSSIITLLILTLIGAIIIEGIAFLIWGDINKSLPSFLGIQPFHLFRATVFGQNPWVIGISLLLVTGLSLSFEHTIFGKALRACADNPLGARMMGISADRMALFSFVLAAALGALAGAVVTPLTTTSCGIGLHLAIKGALAAFIGGLTSATGIITGGVALGVVEAMAKGLIHSGLEEAIALGIFVAMLLFRPGGMLGALRGGR